MALLKEAVVGSEKSTNVRFEGAAARPAVPLAQRLLHAGLTVGERVAPELSAAIVDRMFFTPMRHRAPEREREILATGESFRLDIGGERIAVWKWGSGPRVYLLHGWAGRAGQMGAFVEPLVARGFSVIAFDAPAHGRSSGRMTSAVEVARVLRTLIERLGEAHAVIAHSAGGWATAFAAFEGARVGKIVVIGSTTDPAGFAEGFARSLGIGPGLMERMRVRAERRIGVRFADLPIERRLRELKVPGLVVHDADDREVPLCEGRKYAEAWPGARLIVTEGLGHRRVLRDPEVVRQVVNFVSNPLRVER